MKKLKISAITLLLLLPFFPAAAIDSLAQKLSGKILLQVQSAGEAWYVNPADGKKYYLGRPADAFAIMRKLSIGITNADLNNIPADKKLTDSLRGKILLQVQSAGEAWYVNPADGKKYYLGRPADAFAIMRRLSLGITNADLARISTGYIVSQPASSGTAALPNQESVPAKAAEAVRSNDAAKTKSYFTAGMGKAIEYTMNILSADSRLLLANILSGAKLAGSNDTEKTYAATAYFSLGGYEVPLRFYVKKQPDGSWLMTNL